MFKITDTIKAYAHYGEVCITVGVNHSMAGPIGRVVWGVGLDGLDAETLGLNPA
jgi:hypothetical protein